MNRPPRHKRTPNKPAMSTSRARSAKQNVTQSGAAMKSAITDLRQTHGTADKLKRALKGMEKLTLEALILNSVFPEVCNVVVNGCV